MMQTANSGRPQYTDKARKYMEEYMDEGYLCGQAAMKALAGAYEIPLCQEILHQSLTFTEGGGVGDRCAVFQASLVLIGLQYGRIEPDKNREVMRQAAFKLAEDFRKAEGSYFCRDIDKGSRESCIQLAGTAADILGEIFEEKKMNGRLKRFKVQERMVPYVSYFMNEEDWSLVDLAQENGGIPQEQCSEEQLDKAYKKGILNKRKEGDGIHYYLGTFHKRIDCCLRGERVYFETLPPEVRNAVVEYEQDIHLWVIPYREEGVNKKIVNPVPIEKALDIIENTNCRYYVQECDCKIYRHEQKHMKETCIHFFDEDKLLNSNFDRGYGKELTKEEVKRLLIETDRDGLIHNFEGDSFCNCCSCCCWAVRGIKTYEEEGYDVFGEYINAEYIIASDKDKCAGCGACREICPMNAMKLMEGKISVSTDQCIGCGVCRTRCRFGALSIQRREGGTA